MKTTPNVVQEANKIPIEQVLMDQFNIDVPADAGSWKTNCPLESEHSDGGIRKSMRVYSNSNSAWCFSHGMKFTPVYLWQLATGLSKVRAAYDLLNVHGQPFRSQDYAERWDKMNEKETKRIEMDNLREAIRLFASSLPQFSTRQYDPQVMKMLTTIFTHMESLDPHSDYDTIESTLNKYKEILTKYWRSRGWN